MLPLAARLLTENGICLLLKGATVDAELLAAEQDWTMAVTRTPSNTGSDGIVLRISGLRRLRDQAGQR